MTDDRYTWWCGEISRARSAGDTGKLAALQLDYNLELGSCLAHQSQRTKDIKAELQDVKTALDGLGDTVTRLENSVATLAESSTRTADAVTTLTDDVKELVSYRDSIAGQREGFKTAWRVLCGGLGALGVLGSTVYAIYRAAVFVIRGS